MDIKPTTVLSPEPLAAAPAHQLPELIVCEAARIAGAPAALYVADLDGSCLRRAAGSLALPGRLEFSGAIGPEIPEERFGELGRAVQSQLLGSAVHPLAIHGRAIAVLVVSRASTSSLDELAREVAIAVEVASHYTDVLAAGRRRTRPTAAAEAQHDMLPPRVARLEGAELAGTVLPAYDVGGDWFDHAENSDGTWLALADALGKGAESTALSAIALGALRAARRDGATVDATALAVHEAIYDLADPSAFVTAVIARWERSSSRLSLINCGNVPPLLQRGDGRLEVLSQPPTFPLGLFERERTFSPIERILRAGERLLIYSDGVTERRTADGGFLGEAGLAHALAAATPGSAAAAVSAIEQAVISASPSPLRDDATILVLKPTPEDPPPTAATARFSRDRHNLNVTG